MSSVYPSGAKTRRGINRLLSKGLGLSWTNQAADGLSWVLDHLYLLASASHYIQLQILKSASSIVSSIYLLCFFTVTRVISQSLWLLESATPHGRPSCGSVSLLALGQVSPWSHLLWLLESTIATKVAQVHQAAFLSSSWETVTWKDISLLCDSGHFSLTSLSAGLGMPWIEIFATRTLTVLSPILALPPHILLVSWSLLEPLFSWNSCLQLFPPKLPRSCLLRHQYLLSLS